MGVGTARNEVQCHVVLGITEAIVLFVHVLHLPCLSELQGSKRVIQFETQCMSARHLSLYVVRSIETGQGVHCGLRAVSQVTVPQGVNEMVRARTI